jgi:hypothetical protein
MIGCGQIPGNPTLIIATLLIAVSAPSAVAKSELESHQPSQSSAGLMIPAPRAPEPLKLRVAKIYKYEIPKAQRAPEPAPQSSAPSVQSVPSNNGPPVVNKGRYRGTPSAKSSGGSSGSCELCRNSCYVSYRVRSFSSQFVPCMHACWSQLCRR